jgi:ABC-2 type transport system ATP-binding protein
MEYVIETEHLNKKYVAKYAVKDVSLHVERGDIYGLIGNNGAGKTTLMKILLDLTVPNSGEIKLFGSHELGEGRKRIGSLIEAPAIYKRESAFENMKRMAILTGDSDERINELLAFVGLASTGKKRAGAFSLGMRQRLGIAMALLGKPEILILDEPVNGLDPAGIKDVRDLLLALNSKGITILISSHLLDELGKIATKYGIISNGALVEEISAEDVAKLCRSTVEVRVDDPVRAAQILSDAAEGVNIEVSDQWVSAASDTLDVSSINLTLVQNSIAVYEIKTHSVGAEEFFIERMGR